MRIYNLKIAHFDDSIMIYRLSNESPLRLILHPVRNAPLQRP